MGKDSQGYANRVVVVKPSRPTTNNGDYHGVQGSWFESDSKKPTLQWARFKWIMFIVNIPVQPLFICFFALLLNIHFAVGDLLVHFPHSLPAHVVPHVGLS